MDVNRAIYYIRGEFPISPGAAQSLLIKHRNIVRRGILRRVILRKRGSLMSETRRRGGKKRLARKRGNVVSKSDTGRRQLDDDGKMRACSL